MNTVTTEWVIVSDSTAIIARETGEFWFLELDDWGDVLPFARPMTGKGTLGSSAALLNGAVALGLGSDEGGREARAASLPKYVFDLVGAYHNTRRTPGNFMQAARCFRELGRTDIASYLETHAREETGHDRLILRDLRALSLPAERIVTNLVPEGVKGLCELFDRLSSSDYPIGCIGYSYCFESLAALKQKSHVDALQALCPEGVDASRFLRTHSSLGAEVNHVEDLIDLIASLPAPDRIEIVKATYETAVRLADDLRRDGVKSDSAILMEIQAAAGEEIHLDAPPLRNPERPWPSSSPQSQSLR
jgi:hypothetical protein